MVTVETLEKPVVEEKSEVVWVPINKVIPNPLNPRRNDSIDADTMKSIIQKRGFEEPLTTYKQGNMYVLLAGHRRLFAAKEAKVRELPVYIVSKPQNEQEELERLASLQSGRVDFTPLEWATFTWNRWNAWGRPPLAKFAKEINLKPSAVKQYINVMEYYPISEIEKDLQTKNLNMSSLDALVKWIKALKKHKESLVEDMSEEMIRKIMLQKIVHKKANRDDLRNTEYCEIAKEDQIREFLIDRDMELESHIGYIGIKKKFKDFKGHLISMGHMSNRIPHIKPDTDLQKENARESLLILKRQIEEKLKELQ